MTFVIVWAARISHAEGAHGFRIMFLRQRRNGTKVDPAGQRYCDGHIGAKRQLYGILDPITYASQKSPALSLGIGSAATVVSTFQYRCGVACQFSRLKKSVCAAGSLWTPASSVIGSGTY